MLKNDMDKTKKIAELTELLEKDAISESDYIKLKDEIINEKQGISKFKTDSINWLAVITLVALIALHFISAITIKVKPGNTHVFFLFPLLFFGASSLIVSIATLICAFFRLRFLWVGGVITTLMIILTLIFGGSLSNSVSSNVGDWSASAGLNWHYSPGFFYMLFCLFLFGFSLVFQKTKKPVLNDGRLSTATVIFAWVGILGASLKLIQEISPVISAVIAHNVSGINLDHLNVALSGELPDYMMPPFLKHDTVSTTIWASLCGLSWLGYPLLILVSQIFILLRKRVFIYVFIIPWILTLFWKIYIGSYNAWSSEYYGYIMELFWDTEHENYSITLHAIGSTVFFYLMPLLFFYMYFRDRYKMY